MNARLIAALTTVGLLGLGTIAPALASEPESRHNICIKLTGSNPTDPRAGGYCIGWDDPLGQNR